VTPTITSPDRSTNQHKPAEHSARLALRPSTAIRADQAATYSQRNLMELDGVRPLDRSTRQWSDEHRKVLM